MFITKTDITGSGIHEEILNALTRSTDQTVEDLILVAIDEAGGYLAARYDVNAIFSAVGSARNETVKQRCIDIALYHIHSKANPNILPDIRVKRYDDAIDWLKGVQSGNITPPGLPLLNTDSGVGGMISYGSNPKRVNHY